MKIISHRGNINGSNLELENTPQYIQEALDKGYDVEIDVWYNLDEDKFYLGHDSPYTEILEEYLDNDKFWVHAKNLEALDKLVIEKYKCNYFWHQNDNFTLTSNNYIWTYPNKLTTPRSILVDLELENFYVNGKNPIMYGVCTDQPIKLSETLIEQKNETAKEERYKEYVVFCGLNNQEPISFIEFKIYNIEETERKQKSLEYKEFFNGKL